jgi:hypothetical protein
MPGMISMSRRLYVPVLVLAAAGFLSACGGGSSNSTASNTSTTAAASSPAAPAGGDAKGFCNLVEQDRAILQGTELSGLLTGGSADAWKAYLDKVTVMNQQLVDASPAEIQADMKTLQATSLQLKSAMEAANYDVSKVGIAQLSQTLQSPQQKTATNNVVAYVSKQCAIDLTKLG